MDGTCVESNSCGQMWKVALQFSVGFFARQALKKISHSIERRANIFAADVGIMNLQKKLCQNYSLLLSED